MDIYQPGAHIIATLRSADKNLLSGSAGCKGLIDELIQKFSLSNLGEVYHDFLPAGFTAVVCLSESHIAIHTWPEYDKINLDIYLSNYQKNNDGTVQNILNELVSFFNATITDITTIKR